MSAALSFMMNLTYHKICQVNARLDSLEKNFCNTSVINQTSLSSSEFSSPLIDSVEDYAKIKNQINDSEFKKTLVSYSEFTVANTNMCGVI